MGIAKSESTVNKHSTYWSLYVHSQWVCTGGLRLWNELGTMVDSQRRKLAVKGREWWIMADLRARVDIVREKSENFIRRLHNVSSRLLTVSFLNFGDQVIMIH